MNKITNYIFVLLMAAAVSLLPACSKDEPFPGGTEQGAVGTVNFRKMVVEVSSSETLVRSSVDVGSFVVEVADGTKTHYFGTYAEMPEVLSLPVGDSYTVTVKSPANPDAGWDTPYYEGTQSFAIEEGEVTYVDPVVCRFSNIKVTVKYTEDLKKVMGDDCTVEVVAGETGRLTFTKDESRSGYFRYTKGQGQATMVATFHGTVDENLEENFRTYTNLAPGQHYIITYSLHTPGGDVTALEGTLTPGVYVDATVVRENMNINVDVDDDILADDKRPGEDGGDEPDPPVPGDGPQVVSTVDGVETDFSTPVMVHDGITVKVKVDSKADGGITQFVVDIDSETLTPSELESVGLAAHLDLVSPGRYEEALAGMGFPVNVRGMTDVPEFDISTLIPMLKLLGEPGKTYQHRFKLTVGDADGTTEFILHFESQN